MVGLVFGVEKRDLYTKTENLKKVNVAYAGQKIVYRQPFYNLKMAFKIIAQWHLAMKK